MQQNLGLILWMLKNKIKAVKSRVTKLHPSQRLCDEHKFSYFDPTVSESKQIVGDYNQLCRASETPTAQPGHTDTARNTCTLLLEEPLRSGSPLQVTWSRITEKGQTGAAELHIQVGISRAALTRAKQEMLRFV